MSFKTRTKKRAMRRQQKQARAANASIDELFRKRGASRTHQARGGVSAREPPDWP